MTLSTMGVPLRRDANYYGRYLFGARCIYIYICVYTRLYPLVYTNGIYIQMFWCEIGQVDGTHCLGGPPPDSPGSSKKTQNLGFSAKNRRKKRKFGVFPPNIVEKNANLEFFSKKTWKKTQI